MITLSDLLLGKDEFLSGLANQALNYSNQLALGKLSQDEYDSLCSELLDVKDALIEAKSEQKKQEIKEAVAFLGQFLKL
jgi:hypothetical protein